MKAGQTDYILLVLAGILVVFGLIALTSASSVVAFEKWGDSFYLIKHQLIFGFLPGLLLFIFAIRVHYNFWRKTAPLILVLILILLVLVLLPGFGASLSGSKSWLLFGGISIQPSELAKIGIIFYLAAWLEKREGKIKDFAYGFLPFLLLLGSVILLIALQPDVGTMLIISAIAILMYFFAGAAWRHIVFLGSAGLFFLALLVKVAPYRTARLMIFVYPELDPQGIGYHINQALLTIGSGGLFGLGFGQSRQKFRYLPEVSGDSIFAIISEEFGFLISVALIVVMLLFFYRVFKLARNAPDVFTKLVALGILSWLAAQSFVNISAMVGILPMTGLPLPFISYGGTALAVSLFAVGVLGNISRYAQKTHSL